MARTGNYDPREYQVAVHLHSGAKSASEACRKAGYSEASVRTRASKIVKREGVRLALMELAAGLKPGELGSMAKARVYEKLIDLPKGKERSEERRVGKECR